MEEQVKSVTALLRLPEILRRTGHRRSTFYHLMQRRLVPRLIKIGARASALPAHEVDALVAAKIRGESPEQLRALVERLEAERSAFK